MMAGVETSLARRKAGGGGWMGQIRHGDGCNELRFSGRNSWAPFSWGERRAARLARQLSRNRLLAGMRPVLEESHFHCHTTYIFS